MIEQQDKAWYVARRGELLTQQFLLELEPCNLSSMQDSGLGIDYTAFFQKSDDTIIVIAVEVKVTEQPVKECWTFPASQAKKLLKMNIPVLVVVVDVKENNIYFNWIREAIVPEHREALEKTTSCVIPLRTSTEQEREQLKREILQS